MAHSLTIKPWTNLVAEFSAGWACLVAVADLETILERTALTGSSAYSDMLILCPGMHKQQHATQLNRAEFPAAAALTTDYIFRIENPATVLFLQKVGQTGHLVTLAVSGTASHLDPWQRLWTALWTRNASVISSMSYLTTMGMTLTTFTFLIMMGDRGALVVLTAFMFSRFCNVLIIRRRTQLGWKGVPEPGVKGDLLILLSQDRWIRMQGNVDDLKVVTSGQWMRDMTFAESSLEGAAMLLVYLAAALACNAQQVSQIAVLTLLILSAACLGISNHYTQTFQMFGRSVEVVGEPKAYERRRLLADELIESTGRKGWAIRLGMINPDESTDSTPMTKVVM